MSELGARAQTQRLREPCAVSSVLGVRNSRLRGFLVAGQVAVSVVLLICTATLVRNARAAAERTWALTLVDGNGAIIIPGDS